MESTSPQQEHSVWYEAWFDSPYYHQLYQHRDEREARVLVHRLLHRLALPAGSRVADLACGRGRHAVILYERGLDVTGLDLSASNINEAQKLATAGLRFAVHNIRFPYRRNYFQAAFNFFTSFGYEADDEENACIIHAAAQSLVPGGYFVLDYLNPGTLPAGRTEPEVRVAGSASFVITRWCSDHFVHKRIVVHDARGEHVFEERVRLFSQQQLVHFFAAAGLAVLDVAGDYQLNAYDFAGSPRMILIGKKNESVSL
jgi:SAM-dependent methyltransferase